MAKETGCPTRLRLRGVETPVSTAKRWALSPTPEILVPMTPTGGGRYMPPPPAGRISSGDGYR